MPISKKLVDLLWRLWYPVLSRLTRNEKVVFLNYGYEAVDGEGRRVELLPEDQGDRVCIQLYDRVGRLAELAGKDVLEVSCGHGGGASYLARYMKPRSMRGVDRNARAIERCRRQHNVAGLTFSCGDAMGLEFAEGSFDGVVNVEASHCYPDAGRFFGEVQRVLRPGGHFLYTDFRGRGVGREVLEAQLKASGMEIVSCEDISRNVVAGMRVNTEKYMGLIRRLMPGVLRKPAMGFAGVKGSGIYRELESGETVYLLWHLRKSQQPGPG